MDAVGLVTASWLQRSRLQRSKDPKGTGDSNKLYKPVEGEDRVHEVVTNTRR